MNIFFRLFLSKNASSLMGKFVNFRKENLARCIWPLLMVSCNIGYYYAHSFLQNSIEEFTKNIEEKKSIPEISPWDFRYLIIGVSSVSFIASVADFVSSVFATKLENTIRNDIIKKRLSSDSFFFFNEKDNKLKFSSIIGEPISEWSYKSVAQIQSTMRHGAEFFSGMNTIIKIGGPKIGILTASFAICYWGVTQILSTILQKNLHMQSKNRVEISKDAHSVEESPKTFALYYSVNHNFLESINKKYFKDQFEEISKLETRSNIIKAFIGLVRGTGKSLSYASGILLSALTDVCQNSNVAIVSNILSLTGAFKKTMNYFDYLIDNVFHMAKFETTTIFIADVLNQLNATANKERKNITIEYSDNNEINIKNVNIRYPNEINPIVKDLSSIISFSNKRIIQLTGQNSSGKSSLLYGLSMALEGSGTITLPIADEGQVPFMLIPSAKDTKFLEKFSLEEVMTKLFNQTINENSFKKEYRTYYKEIYNEDLDDNIFKKISFSELSTGTLQVHLIIFALIIKPRTLVLDEAFANVDSTKRTNILNALNNLPNTNTLFIYHDEVSKDPFMSPNSSRSSTPTLEKFGSSNGDSSYLIKTSLFLGFTDKYELLKSEGRTDIKAL